MRLPRMIVSLVVVAASATSLPAQAPRETAVAAVGSAKLSIEYGSPPWNEQRTAQIERALPVGAAWRIGADQRTTFLVDGGDVLLGDALIERGGFGLNLRRTGEKSFAFVVFDGTDADVQLQDEAIEAPATLETKADAAPPRLVVSFAERNGRQALLLRFGPSEISVPVTAVETRESEIAFGDETSSARWFVRGAKDAPAAGAAWRAGTIGSFFRGDVDCAMDVELRVDGASAKVRFVNRERARVTSRLARVDGAVRQAARREAARAQLQTELEALAANPLPFEVTVPLAAAKPPPGRFGAELLRRDGRLVVVVQAGDRAGEAAVDEEKLFAAPGREKN